MLARLSACHSAAAAAAAQCVGSVSRIGEARFPLRWAAAAAAGVWWCLGNREPIFQLLTAGQACGVTGVIGARGQKQWHASTPPDFVFGRRGRTGPESKMLCSGVGLTNAWTNGQPKQQKFVAKSYFWLIQQTLSCPPLGSLIDISVRLLCAPWLLLSGTSASLCHSYATVLSCWRPSSSSIILNTDSSHAVYTNTRHHV